MRKSYLAAAIAFAVAGGAMTLQASAADLEYLPSPPPPYLPAWQGFYIGGHVGYGEADFERDSDVEYFDFDPVLEVFAPGIDVGESQGLTADGLIGGVQAGYNWQVNALVFGLEGDVSFADWSHSSVVFDEPLDDFGAASDVTGQASVDVDMLATIRGRLGMAFGNALLYGTGGLAWADAGARMRVDRVDDGGDVENLWTRNADFDDLGFVVGGGFAWMVIPRTFSVGVEGLYYFFDEEKVLFEDTIVHPNDDEVDVRTTASLNDAWVLRARADFHF